jgi:hypothetical protein
VRNLAEGACFNELASPERQGKLWSDRSSVRTLTFELDLRGNLYFADAGLCLLNWTPSPRIRKIATYIILCRAPSMTREFIPPNLCKGKVTAIETNRRGDVLLRLDSPEKIFMAVIPV